VKKHLEMALRSMEGVEDGSFGIALFDTQVHADQRHSHADERHVHGSLTLVPLVDTQSKLTGLGDTLWPTTSSNVALCIGEVEKIQAQGGNGGEAACLRACLSMGPQAVFFLGDGGWDADALIAEAKHARGVTIHSIAFFTTGGGLREIASMTGGSYREINSMDFDAAAGGANRKAPVSSSEGESETETDDSDEAQGGM